MENYFFSVKKMTVGYGGVPLIRDIDVTLKKGEILTLIGPNGAGKSTILKSIMGQLRLLSGAVFLEGKQLSGMCAKELSKKMSIVLTEPVRAEMMTGRDVVASGRYPYTGRLGLLSPEDKKIVQNTMELVKTEDLAERDFATLSDGQRQRIMLARALVKEPEILVLDEPISFLDVRYQVEFLSLLQRMAKKRGLTVVMSLHELDLAERISDKILCVKGEYVERVGTPETIFSPGFINSLYGFEEGSFDECFCRVELEKAKGKPRVFVIGGGGKASAVYRRLQREGIPFATGILWENDQDTPVAQALAVKVIKEAAFCKIREDLVKQAEAEIDACESVICPFMEFGELNVENERLFGYAGEKKKLKSLDAWRTGEE